MCFSMRHVLLAALLALTGWDSSGRQPKVARGDDVNITGRRPASDDELKYWLENALLHHRFKPSEAAAALNMTDDEVRAAVKRLNIESDASSSSTTDGNLLVLPYPGGRHPRIGFLEGAIDPQRETKVSVFTPWQPEGNDRADYVVLDVPEAIWSNLGLTYLAHTHVPTIWTNMGVELEKLEWERRDDRSLFLRRQLPNGIAYTSLVVPRDDHVEMTMTLSNGTADTLTDLRVQNCVMLKGAEGFTAQTNENKLFRAPYVACHDESGTRWVITAWVPNHRSWGNQRCPCLHSDPKFPDCPPGETRTLRGWLSFYEGTDIEGELKRLESLAWWKVEG